MTTKKFTINLFPLPFLTWPLWIAGIVIASGFWSTLFAIFMPLWAWYLAVEKLLAYFGVI